MLKLGNLYSFFTLSTISYSYLTIEPNLRFEDIHVVFPGDDLTQFVGQPDEELPNHSLTFLKAITID